MNIRKIFPILFVLIFNLWLYKILIFSVLMGIVVILSSIFIYLTLITKKKKYFLLSSICISILMIIQYKTSSINSLTYLNENEKIEQRQRMTGYPRYFYRFANWFEQRKEALIFYKMQENLFEVIDPNLYFFANHPRERVGIVEFEKFPYIYMPFLIIGIFFISNLDIGVMVLSISPFILLSLIGNSNPMGPFSVFPSLAAFTAKGLEPVFRKRKYLLVFLLVFLLVLIQTISYERY